MTATAIAWVWMLAAPLGGEQLQPLSDLIVEWAQTRLPADAVSLEVVDLKLPAGMPERVGPGRVVIRFRPGEDFSGPTSVRVDVDGRSRWVRAELELMVPAAVAKTALRRGHVLRPFDVELRSVPARLLQNGRSAHPRRLAGMILERDLGTGDPVLLHRLRRPFVIRRGDRVEIEVRGQGVSIRSSGEAMAAGRVGDAIVVKRLGCDRRIRAKVVGSGRVLIPLAGERRGVMP